MREGRRRRRGLGGREEEGRGRGEEGRAIRREEGDYDGGRIGTKIDAMSLSHSSKIS